MSSLYLVDASIYIFRAYFSLPETITNAKGHPANAVFGYASFLSGLVSDANPVHIAAMFDESLDTCFRNEIHPQYKSNRAPPRRRSRTPAQLVQGTYFADGHKDLREQSF